jgi:hypothetical protein
MRRRTRRSASTIAGGTPDMTIGRADADQAGARPSYGGCQAWIGVFSDYFMGLMFRVTGHRASTKQYLIE